MLKLDQLLQPILGQSVPILDWLVPFRGTCFQGQSAVLVDGAAITVNGLVGDTFIFTAPNNTARVFSPPSGLAAGAVFRIQVKNTSGGAIAATTFNAAYHGAPTLPATGFTRVYTWLWDGAVAYLVSQSPADLAN